MAQAPRTLVGIYADTECVGFGRKPDEIMMRVQFVKEAIRRECNVNGVTNQKVMTLAYVHALALDLKGMEQMWKKLDMAVTDVKIVTSTKPNAMDMAIQNQVRNDAVWAKENGMKFVPAIVTGDTDYVYLWKALAMDLNVPLRIMAFGHQMNGAKNVLEHIEVALDLTDLRPWNVMKCLMDLEKGKKYPKVEKNGYDWTGYYKRDGYQGPEKGFGARMAPPQQQQPLKDQRQKPMVGV